MGKKDWDIEECRTKFESEEHWNLKKEFLLAHKDKINKKRLKCLAQVFVNVHLMRCKYPDPVMRQVAELSKGIGVDYKTRQKERLQRTFVKASDAASAKVKGLKPNYSKTSSESKSDNDPINDQKEIPEDKTTNVTKPKSKHPIIVWDKGETKEEPPKKKRKNKYSEAVKSETSETNSNTYLNSFVTPKVASILKTKSKKLDDETSQASSNTYLNSFVTPTSQSVLKTKVRKLEDSTTDSLSKQHNFENDLYSSNIFLVSRNYCTNVDHNMILTWGLAFSKLKLNEVNRRFKNQHICVLSTRVNGQVLKLGQGESSFQKEAREKAIENSLKNLLQKCYTIEIKNKVDDDTQVSMDMLTEEFSDPPKAEIKNEEPSPSGSENFGAKMLKLMGWTGGGLGKKEDGIKEPISVSTPIGRAGLGLRDENAPIPAFKNKVKVILEEMKTKVLSAYDNIVKDVVFSSDLSNEQRKHIHLLVRSQYKQLKSVSYGSGDNRFLVIKPKNDPKTLIRKVLLQGGSTDNYTIHTPGTLSADDIISQGST